MNIPIESGCPNCFQNAFMDVNKDGWYAYCGMCSHRVSGHVRPDSCLRAFQGAITTKGYRRHTLLPGGRLHARAALAFPDKGEP